MTVAITYVNDKSLQSVRIKCAIRTIGDQCVHLQGINPVCFFFFVFFFGTMLLDPQIKASKIAEAPLKVSWYKVRNKQIEIHFLLFFFLFKSLGGNISVFIQRQISRMMHKQNKGFRFVPMQTRKIRSCQSF